MKKINLLDCSFRDGGYYNNWNFSEDETSEYLKKILLSNVDIIEIGFRFLQKNKNYGPYAFSNDIYLKNINNLNKKKTAVMVNTADFFKFNKNLKSTFDENFINVSKSRFSIIRFATKLEDVCKILDLLRYVKKKGFRVFLNLMQINRVSENELIQCLRELKKSNSIDVFYIADTFGNLTPKNVKYYCNIIKKNWPSEFGIHAHNNCGFALENSLTAIECGASWVDGTVQGMGRGAGNVSTESLVCEFGRMGITKFIPEHIYSLSQSFFLEYKKKYNWGTSVYYHFAAINNIHPSYVQEILIDNRYSHDQIINILKGLKNNNSISYNPKNLKALTDQKIDFKHSWNARNFLKNKSVLILGQGINLQSYKEKIYNYIKKKNIIVFSLNINKYFDKKKIDYYLVSDPARMSVDSNEYKKLTKTLVVPFNLIQNIFNWRKIKKIKNFGLIVGDKIKVQDNYCILPNALSIGYAISLCSIAGVKKIFLAGFDGYKNNFALQEEMNNYLLILKKEFNNIKISSLTPTNYRIKRVKF